MSAAALNKLNNPEQKVELNVSIATPYLGVPLVTYLFFGGDIKEFYSDLNDVASWYIGLSQIPALYQLQSALEVMPMETSEYVNNTRASGYNLFLGYPNFEILADNFPVPRWSAWLNGECGETVQFIEGYNSKTSCYHTDLVSNERVLTYIENKIRGLK